MMFVKLGSKSIDFGPGLNATTLAVNRIKISMAKYCVLSGQGFFAYCKIGAKRKMLQAPVLLRNGSYEREKVWVRKVLLLFQFLVGGH